VQKSLKIFNDIKNNVILYIYIDNYFIIGCEIPAIPEVTKLALAPIKVPFPPKHAPKLNAQARGRI
jgi:hypothetical protein